VDYFGWLFTRSIGEADVHLRRVDSAAIDLHDVDAHAGKAQPLRHGLQPFRRRPRGDKCTEQHVAADPRNRIDDGKPSI
jgi:hypothetical protein